MLGSHYVFQDRFAYVDEEITNILPSPKDTKNEAA